LLRSVSWAVPLSHCTCEPGLLTSSDLFGREVSSDFLDIFCPAGRVAVLLSSTTSLEADRLAVGVLPRAVLGLGAMLDDCCEPEAACEEVIEDDEFLGRAVAGGVERFNVSMTASCSSW
jgi:hypothetical protein